MYRRGASPRRNDHLSNPYLHARIPNRTTKVTEKLVLFPAELPERLYPRQDAGQTTSFAELNKHDRLLIPRGMRI
jgi:hypothetical protein